MRRDLYPCWRMRPKRQARRWTGSDAGRLPRSSRSRSTGLAFDMSMERRRLHDMRTSSSSGRTTSRRFGTVARCAACSSPATIRSIIRVCFRWSIELRSRWAPAVASDMTGPRVAVVHVLGTIAETPVVERPLPPAFAQFEQYNQSELVSDDPVTISSTAPIAGYVASMNRTARPSSPGLEALQVRLCVREGVAGVGLLDASEMKFLDLVDGFEPGSAATVTFLIRGMQ